MKSSRRSRLFSTTSPTTVLYSSHNNHSPTVSEAKRTEIPIESGPDQIRQSPAEPVPITVQLRPKTQSNENLAAVKIQSAYRSHVILILVKKISAVNSEANYWQRIIQRQETVDAIRNSQGERIKINEALMKLLFKLDSIPGIEPNVRELRRHVSRKIVGLQEILDAVSDARVENWDGYLRDWDDMIAGIEKQVCRDEGGDHDMEKFCAENLGFQCLQKFLRDI